MQASATPDLNPVAVHGQLHVVGSDLRDAAGQPVQLKGVSSQWLNYESKTFPESKPAIAYARDHWKLSVIRAAMGVDAAGGYLGTGTGANADAATMQTKVDTIIQNAIDLGIYVIVDWHTSNAVTATGSQATQAAAFFSDIPCSSASRGRAHGQPGREAISKIAFFAASNPHRCLERPNCDRAGRARA